MNKSLVLFGLVFMMSFFYGTVTTLAFEVSDEETIESFKSVFDLRDRDLIYISENSNISRYTSYLYLDTDDRNNVYGSFSFSSGLERLKFSAFTCEKNMIGFGEEGTAVGMLVYTQSGEERTVLDYKMRTLGASGLYSDEIEFAYNQVQYLVVAVKTDGEVYSHVYEVTTKEEATKSLLEHYEIKFGAEEEEEATIPEFDLSVIMDYEF